MKTEPIIPILQTKRLRLRPINGSDQDLIFHLRSDPEVNRYIERELLTAIGQAQDFLIYIQRKMEEGKIHYWALEAKSDGMAIGTLCLWNFNHSKRIAEVGYELSRGAQGQGYMREALEGVIDYGFHTLSLQAIAAFTHKDNQASKALLKRLGFELLPDRRDPGFPQNWIFQLKNLDFAVDQ